MSVERAVWLIVAEGGWWTPAEVIPHLPERYAEAGIDTVSNRMWIMAERRGYLKRKTVGPRCTAGSGRYAVTPDCCMPYSITVGEVMRAAGGTE